MSGSFHLPGPASPAAEAALFSARFSTWAKSSVTSLVPCTADRQDIAPCTNVIALGDGSTPIVSTHAGDVYYRMPDTDGLQHKFVRRAEINPSVPEDPASPNNALDNAEMEILSDDALIRVFTAVGQTSAHDLVVVIPQVCKRWRDVCKRATLRNLSLRDVDVCNEATRNTET